ncbi:hypothetical protein OIU80_20605 [Flavobacterium sp. LS1R47]|uniref:Uncharacterized protein n=1 Tax=Flavobacterium frigoritolerans TaxID=2987686 RepID=A0A9X3HNS2_9FLAO|nr:hypothetical protein [Flavobacterium frigoritolerans]MCV9934689.1 hypothetical protein [Flavobacterium frigoritolerans]
MKSTAKKSDSPTNALINRNFIIRVLENPSENLLKNTKLTSANKLSTYLNDDEMKIKLFNKILDGGKDKYTFLIRNRLKIDFQSK